MNKGIHFISGLPRSGSTLLSALLRQNPRLHASITSPVSGLVLGALREMSGANEGSTFFDDERRSAVLKNIVKGYYYDVMQNKTVFDTNRGWTARLALLDRLYPRGKVICCVRHMPWIYDSFESIIQKHPLLPSKIFGYEVAGTVYDRFDALNRGNGVVGAAWNSLRQGFFGPLSNKLILVKYETLARDPKFCMTRLYNALDLEPYKHDFDNVEFAADEFDSFLSTPGLHAVKRKVEYVERQPVIPPDLFHRVAPDSFWQDPAKNIHGVPVI